MMKQVRYLAALAAAALTALAGIASAPTVSALSVCAGQDPPDWCFPSEPDPPPAPTNIRATAILQNTVTLEWDNRAGTSATYTVRRTAAGATTTWTVASTSRMTDSSAPAGTQVTYTLWATVCNTLGCTEGSSASKTVTTRPKPADPIGSARGTFAQKWVGGWTTGHFTTDTSRFQMSGWALDFDTTDAISVTITHDGWPVSTITADDPSGTNATYPGYGDDHGFTTQWFATSTVKGSHSACARANNVGGGTSKNLGCFTYETPGKPSAATNVTATQGESSVSVSFTDTANDETGFYLQRQLPSDSSWIQVNAQYAAVAGTGSTQTVKDYSVVPVGTCYRILMTNAYGDTASQPGCTS